MSNTQYFHLRARAGCDECERELVCIRIVKRKNNGKDPYMGEWEGGNDRIMADIRDGFGCPDKKEKAEENKDDGKEV